MSKKVDEYIKSLEKEGKRIYRNVLKPYEAEILELDSRMVLHTEIVVFLDAVYGVKTTKASMSKFISSRKLEILSESLTSNEAIIFFKDVYNIDVDKDNLAQFLQKIRIGVYDR